MKRDWRRTIRQRNLRELAGCAVMMVGLLYLVGLTFRTTPVLAGFGFVAWFIVKHARWQANASDLLGERRELIRQGRLLQFAWAWYVVPCLLPTLIAKPIPMTPFITLVFIGGGIFIAAVNYRAGSKLLEEAHR